MHHTLEEAAFLGSTVVEENQAVLNRDDAIIHALTDVNMTAS